MGLGDADRCRERISWGPHGIPGRAGLWLPPLHPAHSFPGDGQSTDVQGKAPAASPRLEGIRRRLARSFQRAVPHWGSRRAREAAAAALEEQSPARVEGALAGLRAELLEMHFQSHQLARTLPDLNVKTQQWKREYELEITSESQSLKDNAMNPE
ncbi:PREDICTED: alanine and arginine-rich domain-containing protein [Propithecus coquereli]|uniref:Alanine and arginine rich domain containing protein n=1 Tax=Propithecus coquereli TaxID=379532 RepID=A0A2K6EFB6_PROCO|nr:PREDICTED: alanine and arginine-rich domain-containing protein [Propithecus coquereli]